jgi:hypothetical protein
MSDSDDSVELGDGGAKVTHSRQTKGVASAGMSLHYPCLFTHIMQSAW